MLLRRVVVCLSKAFPTWLRCDSIGVRCCALCLVHCSSYPCSYQPSHISMYASCRQFLVSNSSEVLLQAKQHNDECSPRCQGTPVSSCNSTLCLPVHTHVVAVQARGAPRQNATAKDSEWVRTRQALEKDKPPDVNEVPNRPHHSARLQHVVLSTSDAVYNPVCLRCCCSHND